MVKKSTKKFLARNKKAPQTSSGAGSVAKTKSIQKKKFSPKASKKNVVPKSKPGIKQSHGEQVNEKEEDIFEGMDEIFENILSDDEEIEQTLYENDEDDIEVDSDSEDESVDNEGDEALKKVSQKLLDSWKNNPSSKHVTNILKSFHLCLPNDEDIITVDEDLARNIIQYCLVDLPFIFDKSIQLSKGNPSNAPQWKAWKSRIRIFLTDLLVMWKSTSDKTLLVAFNSSMKQYIKYFACFKKLFKNLTDLLHIEWIATDNDVAISAFLNLRILCTEYENRCLNALLKSMYLQFTRSLKSVNSFNASQIQFLINSLVEIYSLSPKDSYQHGFLFIRQLAILLRFAQNTKTPEAVRKVYCWPYLVCLRLWGSILAAAASNTSQSKVQTVSPLSLLIFPYTQIAIGALSFQTSPRFHPFHFHCISSLNEMARSTSTFVPTIVFLLEMLESIEKKKGLVKKSLKPVDFLVNYKVTSNYLDSRVYYDCLTDEATFLLLDSIASSIGSSVAFPELSIPAALRLKHLQKNTRNSKLGKAIQTLLEKLNQQAVLIKSKRDALKTSLVNTLHFDLDFAASPLGVHWKAARQIKMNRIQQQIASLNTQDAPMTDTSKKRPLENGNANKAGKGDKKDKKKRQNKLKARDLAVDDEVVDFILSDSE